MTSEFSFGLTDPSIDVPAEKYPGLEVMSWFRSPHLKMECSILRVLNALHFF